MQDQRWPGRSLPPRHRSHLATPAASPPHASDIRRRCCPTERSWWQADITTALSILAVRNCTTLAAERGVPRVASPSDASITRRHCYPTARSWWQGDLELIPPRNCTILPAERGLPLAAWAPHATFTRRRCCPMARCWWRVDLITASILLRARSCMIRRRGYGRRRP